MQDFFDDLSKRITNTADEVVKITSDAVEVQKLKSQIRTLVRSNERDFTDIGKMVYKLFRDGKIVDESFIGLCEELEKRDEMIEAYEKEISRIKDE